MRRILLAATGTLAATVAVFLYPTSTNKPVTTAAETVAVPSPAATETAAPSATSESSTATPSATDPATTAPAAGDTTASGAASTAASGSFTSSTSMRYGTVSVTVTVANGTITDVSATQSSNDQRSQMISAQAIPTLNSEAVAAQSASISMVSSATYTSQAYAQSLQAAIDQAFGA